MKRLIKILAALAVLFVLLVVGCIVFIDSIVKTAVEEGGSYAMGVETTLDSADIGLFSGEFGISGLAVKNPEGFEKEHFMELDSAGASLALASLGEDTITVPEILLERMSIDLAKGEGGTNYGQILENLERFESGEEEPSEPAGEEEPDADAPPGKKFIVNQIVIKDITVHFGLLPGGDLTKSSFTIPEIILTDVGNSEDGASIASLFSEILKAVLMAAVQWGGDLIPTEFLQDMGGQLGNLGVATFEFTGDLAGSAMEKLGDVGGALGEGAGNVLEGAGEGLGGAVKGIGGLFGGGDDE